LGQDCGIYSCELFYRRKDISYKGLRYGNEKAATALSNFDNAFVNGVLGMAVFATLMIGINIIKVTGRNGYKLFFTIYPLWMSSKGVS